MYKVNDFLFYFSISLHSVFLDKNLVEGRATTNKIKLQIMKHYLFKNSNQIQIKDNTLDNINILPSKNFIRFLQYIF